LLRRQHLFEQIAELHFTPQATRFDVAQNLFEIADSKCQGLHFAQPLMHHLEPLRDQLERLAQALFQSPLQFLVDCLTHLLKAGAIVLLQFGQPHLDRLAQPRHLRRQPVKRAFLQLGQGLERGGDLVAQAARGAGRLLAGGSQILLQAALLPLAGIAIATLTQEQRQAGRQLQQHSGSNDLQQDFTHPMFSF